ncbi:hypothetical protein WRSd5_p00018 (plasmid) [Shigella dysenteriae WRSd5]|nr:hypothetical protein WRSd5_p00018 [Shigella dysenteriae WRSd5]
MPSALIPAGIVANSCRYQRAISGYPSSSTRTNQKTSFLFPASTKNGIFRSAQHSTASSKLSKSRTSASSVTGSFKPSGLFPPAPQK